MRRPLDAPPEREVGFAPSVRAGGRGEVACLREIDYASLRWPTDSLIILVVILLLRLQNGMFYMGFINVP